MIDLTSIRLRILISYHYYKDVDIDEMFEKHFTQPYPEVFADSGSFSAMTQGARLDVDEYAAWIHRWKHRLTLYSNMDVIGDAGATRRNQFALEAHGLQPLPVFHTGEAWSDLEWYLERYNYIGLGGMVPYARQGRQKLMPWLIECFRRAQGRAVFHGFGMTTWSVIKALPWFSVDSSSWGSGFRFGQVPLFDAQAGRFVTVSLGNYAEVYKHGKLFREIGFNPEDFADRRRNDRRTIAAISALAYMRAEAWARKRHGLVYRPDRSEDAGFNMYFVDSRPHTAADLAAADAGLKTYMACGYGNTSPMSIVEGLDSIKPQSGLKTYLVVATQNSNMSPVFLSEALSDHVATHGKDAKSNETSDSHCERGS